MNIPTWSATAAYAINDVVVRVVNSVALLYRALAVVSPVIFARDEANEFALPVAAAESPQSIFALSGVFYLTSRNTATGVHKIFAYNVTTKARMPNADFNTLDAAGNGNSFGLWSDGTTMWVSDVSDDKIYAYNLNTKARDATKDFNTLAAAGNTVPTGIWSDGTTMWVADDSADKIFAYNLNTKARDATKDFNTLSAANNNNPFGIWSDGTTMWVSDVSDDKIYAYNLNTKARDATKDFNTLAAAGNDTPRGIWSDGTTMYVADAGDRVFAYNATGSTTNNTAPESTSAVWEELSPMSTGTQIITAINDAATTGQIDGEHITRLTANNAILPTWGAQTTYAQNQLVERNGNIYRARNAITQTLTQVATWNVGSAFTSGNAQIAAGTPWTGFGFNDTAATGTAPSASSSATHRLALSGNSNTALNGFVDGALTYTPNQFINGVSQLTVGSQADITAQFGTLLAGGGGTWTLSTVGNNTAPESDSANWEEVSSSTGGSAPVNPSLKDWSGTAAYAQNDIVSFNDKIYRAINAIAAGEAETNIATWNVNTAANTQAAQYTAASGIFVFNGTALSGTAPSANSATVHNLELTGNSVRTGTNTATGAIVDYSTGFFATRNIRITDTATMQAAFGNANIQTGGGTWRLYTGGANANPETDTTNWEEQSAGAGGGSDYAGVYADNQSYAVGKYVLHNGDMYVVTTAIPANNTVDPDANTSFALMTLAESAVDAVRPVLSFWDGETNPATDVNTGTTATVNAGSSVSTPYDAANDRLILSQGNGAANQVAVSWSNALIDWNNFAMGFKLERPTKSDGVVLMAFFGCDPNDLPTLPQGANKDEGFAFEISRGNDSAHGLGQGGWTFGLVPFVGGSSNPPNNGRILPVAYYNGAVSGVSGDGNERNYVSLPTSFYSVSEVSMVIVRAGKLIKLYGKDAASQAPAIKFAEWRLTQAQQDRATSSAYGFSGGANNANGQQSYLKEIAVGNPGMTVVEEAFRVGEPQTSGGGGTTYTGGDGIDVTGTVISVDLDGASLTSGSNGVRVTNPFTDDDETKLDGIAAGATVGATAAQEARIAANDNKRTYPQADQTKLAGVATGATVGATATQAQAIANNTNKRSYPQADQTKLAGIAAGATVGATAAQEARIALNDDKRTYPQADQTKLAAIEANATADQSAEEIRDALMTLQGANRLSANFIKDLPNNYKGSWVAGSYNEGNVVEYQGEIYVAAQEIPSGNTTPPSTTNTAWIHLSAEGGSGGGVFNTAADIVNALMGLSGDNRLDVSAVKGVITPSAGTGINVSNTGAISLNTVGAARELSDLTQGDRISASAIAGLQFQTAASIVTALEGLAGVNKLSYDALNPATQPAANAVVINPADITDLNLFLPPNNEVHFGKTSRSASNAPTGVTEESFVIVAKLDNSTATQQIIDSETNKVFVRQYENNAWQGWQQTGGDDEDLVNVTLANSQMTFTRRDGQNPIEFNLPTIVQNTNPYQFFYQVKDIATPTGTFAILNTGDGLDLPFLAKVTPDANTAGVAITNRNFETAPEGFINVAVSGAGVARLDISLKTTHHFTDINPQIPDLITDERVESFEVVLGVATPVALRAFGSDVVLTSSSTGAALAGMAIPISMTVNVKAFNSAGVRVAASIDSINYNKAGITFKQLANNSGATGAQGAKGDRGDDGRDGTDGTNATPFEFNFGTSLPANNVGEDGFVFLDTNNNRVYKRVNGVWTLRYTISGGSGGGVLTTFDMTQQYQANQLVINEGAVYRSKIDVPANTPITDTTYWAAFSLAAANIGNDVYSQTNNPDTLRAIVAQCDVIVNAILNEPEGTVIIGGDQYTKMDLKRITDLREFYSARLVKALRTSSSNPIPKVRFRR